eukprot:Skav202755  [mRNA]  locus=scaffold326:31153:32496:+ [translate_table: standard]
MVFHIAYCSGCCSSTGSAEVFVDDLVEDPRLLPVLEGDSLDSPFLQKVATLFRKFDKGKGTHNGTDKGSDKGISLESLLTTFRDQFDVRLAERDAALIIEAADKNGDSLIDFNEFVEWLLLSPVEKWEEHIRQSFAFETMLLLFWKARRCPVQSSTALGPVPDLPVLTASQALDFVEVIELAELSPDPIQQAVKLREFAAFARRTTGNCLGVMDSVVKHRDNLWKSMEGHRQFLGLQGNSKEKVKLSGVHGRLHLTLKATINLVNIHRKAIYTLHAVNQLFRRLDKCTISTVTALRKRRTMVKLVENFLTTIDSCQKLAFFDELPVYNSIASDLERLLSLTTDAPISEASGELLKELETYNTFKRSWKELKIQYEKSRRLAEGYDDWSIKLWNLSKLALHHVCQQYGLTVPGGNEGKDQDAMPSIPLLKGFREVPSVVIPASQQPGI